MLYALATLRDRLLRIRTPRRRRRRIDDGVIATHGRIRLASTTDAAYRSVSDRQEAGHCHDAVKARNETVHLRPAVILIASPGSSPVSMWYLARQGGRSWLTSMPSSVDDAVDVTRLRVVTTSPESVASRRKAHQPGGQRLLLDSRSRASLDRDGER